MRLFFEDGFEFDAALFLTAADAVDELGWHVGELSRFASRLISATLFGCEEEAFFVLAAAMTTMRLIALVVVAVVMMMMVVREVVRVRVGVKRSLERGGKCLNSEKVHLLVVVVEVLFVCS